MTAIEKLKKIVITRKWYGEHIERRKANVYKSLLKRNKLPNYKASEILRTIGYEPLQEEVW